MKGNPKPTSPAGQEWLPQGNNNATAAGNSQGTALVIPAGQDMTVLTTVAASSGAILPGPYGVSAFEEYVVANHGANAASIYPPVGGKMGTAATNAPYSLAAGKTGYFTCVGGGNYTVNP